MPINFSGKDKLITLLDTATALDTVSAKAEALRRALDALALDDSVILPPHILQPIAGRYARRELHTSLDYGYSAVAMIWSPGQGTSIHDHSGMWCVEGIWQGRLETTQYELVEQIEHRYRFATINTSEASVGTSESLIPPNEYHSVRNPSDHTLAVSIHVYQYPMVSCGIYTPVDNARGPGQWHQRAERTLNNDNVD